MITLKEEDDTKCSATAADYYPERRGSGAHPDQVIGVDTDLRGRDLREAQLQGACLIGADLRGVALEGADLTGADLRRACLAGLALGRVRLRQADLREADLRGCLLSRETLWTANLEGADLAGIRLGPVEQEPLEPREWAAEPDPACAKPAPASGVTSAADWESWLDEYC